MPASAIASVIARTWPLTLGALKLTLSDPSLVSPMPRTIPRTSSPSAIASDSRRRITAAPPLVKMVPEALASKGRQ